MEYEKVLVCRHNTLNLAGSALFYRFPDDGHTAVQVGFGFPAPEAEDSPAGGLKVGVYFFVVVVDVILSKNPSISPELAFSFVISIE